MAPVHAKALVVLGEGLRCALLPKQQQQHRNPANRHQPGCDPKQPPVKHRQKRHEKKRQEGLAHGKPQPGDCQRPPTGRDKPAGHGDDGQMAHHALTRKAQREYHERQKPDGPDAGHEETGQHDHWQDHQTKAADAEPVGQRPRPDHHNSRGTGAKRVDAAPFPMREAEFSPNLAREDRNEIGLPKARQHGQQKSGPQPAGVDAKKRQRVHGRSWRRKDGLGKANLHWCHVSRDA